MARDLSANLIPAAFPSRPKRRDSLASGLNSICIEFLFSDKNHIYYKPLEVFLTIFIKR
jgi:hypothetical protein